MPCSTTARISVWMSRCTVGERAGAGLSTVVVVPRISSGIGIVPLATVAAISSAENGVISTVPWPNPFSARCTVVSATGADPVRVVMPWTTKSRPMP